MIRTINEAEQWFLSHHSGTVEVINPKGKVKICGSFPEAEKHILDLV